MNLYICEKPSQARDLAAVLGVVTKGEGFLYQGDTYVTWAFGHLLELFSPDRYDEKYKKWTIDDLPIIPAVWKNNVKPTSYKQYKVIEGLVAKASMVYIATDFDREGEAIARSLLDRFRYNGAIRRVCLTALDDLSIRKALASTKDGSETVPLYHSALARQRADWLVGMNLSRFYTLLSQKSGGNAVFQIGRVVTPTISLVCQRDNEIKNFKPSPYWELDINVSVQNGQFKARWVVPDECSDDQGRCINRTFASQVVAQVDNEQGVISKAETKKSKESAPLPFDLTSLQQYANKKWGYTAQQVLDIAQSLYEKHKAISYPRTDCRYLPESQSSEVPAVMQGLILSDQNISGLVAGADTTAVSRAFSDSKMNGHSHHGIIPTQAKVNLSAMNKAELDIYDSIRRYYIAQFYADYLFNRTIIEVESKNHLFIAKGKTPLKQGWKIIFGQDEPDEKESKDENEEQDKLPVVNHGEPALLKAGELLDKMTRPAPHFTEATLLSAMENISRYVTEERFKKILKETAGIGTPATRASIIEGAVDKGYLDRVKKTLVATEKAHAIINSLPVSITSAGMTAAWEQELEKITTGDGSLKVFLGQIEKWITSMISSADQDSMGSALSKVSRDGSAAQECLNCGGGMRRIKGKNGFFWACQNESCKKTYNDNKGKPVDPAKAATPPKNAPKCPDCDSPMIKRKGKSKEGKSQSFWGCSGYPNCKCTRPVKSAKKKQVTE